VARQQEIERKKRDLERKRHELELQISALRADFMAEEEEIAKFIAQEQNRESMRLEDEEVMKRQRSGDFGQSAKGQGDFHKSPSRAKGEKQDATESE